MKVLVFALFAAMLIASCTQSENKTEKDLASRVAEKYGVDKFGEVNNLAFTFNIKKDSFEASRTWNWDVKNNLVSYMMQADSGTYKRDTIQSDAMKKIDGMFINDQYWLLFPFHLVWDSSASRSVVQDASFPLSNNHGTKITMQYKNDNGYTPNDAYDLYVDKDNTIKEWAYRKGASDTPNIVTTWQDEKTEKGIRFTTRFNNDSTKFSIFFTNIKVD